MAPTLEDLAQQVTALEKWLQDLPPWQPCSNFKDWRQAVGMCRGNDFMRQIDEAGREIRAADRQEGGT